MAQYKNVSVGTIVLPDDTELPFGETAEVSDEMAGNAGVKIFIDEERLVKVETKSKATKPKKREALEAKANEAGVTFTDEASDADLTGALKALEDRNALIELAVEAGIKGAEDMSTEALEAALHDNK